MFRTAETFRAEVEALTRQTITDHQVEQVLAGIWPDNPDATDRTRASAARRRDAVRSMYRNDPASPAGAAPPTASSRPPAPGSSGQRPAAATVASRSSPACSPAPAASAATSPSESPPSPSPTACRRPAAPGGGTGGDRPAQPDVAALRPGDVLRRRAADRQAPRSSGPSPAG